MHRRAVTFRTDRFESRNPKPHFINPNCFGEDLVAWLRPAPGEPIQEDYGWVLWTELEDLDRLSNAVDRRLRAHPAISEVAWWDGEPFHGASREHP